jgi:uncharacterized integral membrane protein
VIWLIVVAVLVVAVGAFGIQNVQSVTLDYFGARLVAVPLWMVVAVPAAAGVVLGLLMAFPARLRAGFAGRRLTKQRDAGDQAIGTLQRRVIELEGELAAARRPAPFVVEDGEEGRLARAAPGGPNTRTLSRHEAA